MLFSVINPANHAIELMPPQVQLRGKIKKKWTTAQQLPVTDYRLSTRRLARISHRLDPPARGGAASRKMTAPMLLGGARVVEKAPAIGFQTPSDWFGSGRTTDWTHAARSAFRSSSGGGRAELRGEAAGFHPGEHLGKQCRVRIASGERDPDFAHCHPDLRTDFE